MNSRRSASLVLFALAFMAERFSYYALRVTAFSLLRNSSDLTATELGKMYGIAGIVMPPAILLGGAIAFVARPRIAALVGLGLSILGWLFILVHASLPFVFVITTLGSGIFRPSLYIFAGKTFLYRDDEAGIYLPSPRRFAAASAFAMFVTAGASVASSVASVVPLLIDEQLGASGMATFLLLVLVVGCALIGVSLGTDSDQDPIANAGTIQTAYRTAPAAKPPELLAQTKALPMLALLVGVVALQSTWQNMPNNYAFQNRWILSAIPVFAIVGAAIFGAIFHGAGKSESSSQLLPARWLGGGLLTGAIAKLMMLIVPSLWMPLSFLDAAIGPLLVIGAAYAMAAQRSRFLPFIVAGYLAVPSIVPPLTSLLAADVPFYNYLCVFLMAGSSILVLAISRQIHAGFEPVGATQAPPTPAPNSAV